MVRVTARTREGIALLCPSCGTTSRRVHSRYRRHPADGTVGGRPVVIDLSVRRLFCDESACLRCTFVEQVAGLTIRYGRRTPLLQRLLEAIALALAGRAGARLARALPVQISRVALISMVMALPDPPASRAPRSPRVLGVDDFAFRKGDTYGTVLVDVETSAVIDLLDERTTEVLAAWLAAHPGAEVVCRDRDRLFRSVRHRFRMRLRRSFRRPAWIRWQG